MYIMYLHCFVWQVFVRRKSSTKIFNILLKTQSALRKIEAQQEMFSEIMVNAVSRMIYFGKIRSTQILACKRFQKLVFQENEGVR